MAHCDSADQFGGIDHRVTPLAVHHGLIIADVKWLPEVPDITDVASDAKKLWEHASCSWASLITESCCLASSLLMENLEFPLVINADTSPSKLEIAELIDDDDQVRMLLQA